MVRKKKNWILTMLIILVALSACGPSAPEEPLSPQEEKGKRVFVQNCAACHDTKNDLVIVGPPLAGIATRGNERIPGKEAKAYIEESILSPDAYLVEGFEDLMPKTFAFTLTEEEYESLIVYLLTLD